MDKLSLLPVLFSVVFSADVASDQGVKAQAITTALYGSWGCSARVENGSLRMKIASEDTYLGNNRSSTRATLKLQASSAYPEIEYSVTGNATWKVSNGFLVSTFTNVKVVNISHPEFDYILNIQDMFPKKVSESAEVIELSQSKLILRSQTYGTVYRCDRKG
ncbi:MAG: hypothetical protein CMI12_03605 [Oceanospirillum sp.]|nr:hypothetical protein [Oceanospirillum sp.]